MRASYDVREVYVGNGSLDTYSFDFKINELDDLLVIETDENGDIVEEVRGSDTTDLISSVTFDAINGGGSITLLANLASNHGLIIVMAPDEPVQDFEFKNKFDFTLPRFERALDKLAGFIQRSFYLASRGLKLPETLTESDFDPTLPLDITEPDRTIATNATGDAFILGPTATEVANAQGYAISAEEWAVKTDGIVDATDYSSKAWAVGGVDVTETASRGAAKEWAVKTDDAVDTVEFSSKEYAQGVQAGTGGSAKSWATTTVGDVDGVDYSSKEYAQGVQAGTGGSAKDWAIKTDAIVDSIDYSAKEWAIGSQTLGQPGGGSAKDWASYTAGTVDDTEYSARYWAEEAADSAAQAIISANAGLFSGIQYISSVDSPVTVLDTDIGKLYAVDCSSGNVVINLPEIATVNLTVPCAFGFQKTDSSTNTVTINRATDNLIRGGTSIAIARQYSGWILIPDDTQSPDTWEAAGFHDLPAGAVLTDTSTNTVTNKTIDADSNTITNIDNADIKTGAAIERTKLANGTASHVVINDGSGVMSSEAALAKVRGGSGQDNSSLTFPASGTLATLAGTETLSGKTFSDAITLTEIATPTTPSAGLKKFYAKTDGKIYTLNDLGEEVEVGSGGGSGGGKNYFENPEFETNIDGVTTYDDSSAYVNGEGGSPSAITVAFNGTTPLAGEGDLEISKSAADGSGEGVTLTTRTIDRADRGENLIIQFEWDGTHANYASGDMKLYAYSTGTDATILPVYPIAGLNDDGTLPQQKTKIVAYVPTSSTTDSTVRVSLHVETSNASAYDVYVDSFKVGPDMVVPGAIVTDWQSFTPTGSWVSNTTYTGLWRRIGSDIEVQAKILTTGAPTSTSLTINLPSGLTLDTAKMLSSVGTLNTIPNSQTSIWDDNVSTRYAGRLTYNNSTSFFVGFFTDVNTTYERVDSVGHTAPFTWAANDYVNITYKVPIQGWSSGASLSTTEAAFTPWKMRASRTNTVTLTDNTWTKLPFSAPVVLDNISSYDSVNDYFVNRGKKRTVFFAAQINFVASASSRNVGARVYVNGANVTNSVTQPATATNSGSVPLFLGPYELNANDYVELYGYQNDVSGATTLDTTVYSLSIIEVPDFSTFSVFGKSEVIEGAVTTETNWTFTAGQYGDFTSFVLTPGVWELSGSMQLYNAGATTYTSPYFGFATSSGNAVTGASIPKTLVLDNRVTGTSTQYVLLSKSPFTVTVTTPTTYYVKGRINTSITNVQYLYHYQARRIQ